MGVMLQRDSQSQRLYIHDVITEKEDSLISNGNPVTYGAVEESKNLFLTSILRKALLVKDNSMQNSQEDAQKKIESRKDDDDSVQTQELMILSKLVFQAKHKHIHI